MNSELLNTYPKYDSYKESGGDWLGNIPESWKLGRISSFFHERRTKVSDKDYPALSVTKSGVFPQWEHVAKSNDGDNRKLVKKGDFVINSRSDRKGSSGTAKQDGSVSLINIVLQTKEIEPRYSEYLFKSNAFIEEFYRMGHGIVADLWTTRFDNIKNSLMPVPTWAEQTAIADFLDRKTIQLDQAIELKQKQIEKLNEYKQITIQNAVTKGLDTNAKMKDSGIDWMGNIPLHWEVKKLKYSSKNYNCKVSSKESSFRYLGMENVIPHKGEINNEISEVEGLANHFKAGQVLFGKLRPYLSKVYLADFEGICSTEFMVFETNENLLPEFLKTIMLSNSFVDNVNSSTYGSKMPRANPDFINNQYIAVPSLKEQTNIVNHIKHMSSPVREAIKKYEIQIERLKEYKTILINQAVTGKIKVS